VGQIDPAAAGNDDALHARSPPQLGPGLITGAPDDDASGIAIYSQVEVQFDFSMGWVMLFTFPLLAAIQEINAGIGRAMVARDSFIPTLPLDKDHVVAIVAVPLMVMMLMVMAPKVIVCFHPAARTVCVGWLCAVIAVAMGILFRVRCCYGPSRKLIARTGNLAGIIPAAVDVDTPTGSDGCTVILEFDQA
jgi:hypothetical protein